MNLIVEQHRQDIRVMRIGSVEIYTHNDSWNEETIVTIFTGEHYDVYVDCPRSGLKKKAKVKTWDDVEVTVDKIAKEIWS